LDFFYGQLFPDHFYVLYLTLLIVESGGNFIDTANNYQKEESEIWIGEWMKKRGNRDQMVIATKYTTAFRAGHSDKEIIINSTGNGTKSLHLSLAASLKKLQTTYIDLLYVHWWDFTCSIPELMQSLNIMVQQGKVRCFSQNIGYTAKYVSFIMKEANWKSLGSLPWNL